MRVQLVVLAGLIVAVIIAAFVGGDGDGNGRTPGTAAPLPTTNPTTGPTPSTSRGFPPAVDESVCRTLLTTEEAEALVGRPLDEAVIEPAPGQCAWPLDEGSPLNAELFLIVKEREDERLVTVLERDWDQDDFRIEPVDGLGDDAAFMIRRAGADAEEFVSNLDVYAGAVHVVLGNGARDIWDGEPQFVRDRLTSSMRLILERIDERLSGAASG